MNDRLTWSQLALLAGYAIGMSSGQLLFKMAHDGDVKSIQGKYKAITVITE